MKFTIVAIYLIVLISPIVFAKQLYKWIDEVVLITFLMLVTLPLESYPVGCKSPDGYIIKNIAEGMCPKGYEEIKDKEEPSSSIETQLNRKDAGNTPTVEEIEKGPKKEPKEVFKEEGSEKADKKSKEGVSFCTIVVIVFIVLIIYAYLRELKEKEKRIRAIELSDIDNMNGAEFERYVSRL